MSIYRVVWGLGRSEDFATPEEASNRHDKIYADLVETWPMLAGTSDAVLPRILIVSEENTDESGSSVLREYVQDRIQEDA